MIGPALIMGGVDAGATSVNKLVLVLIHGLPVLI